jgi:type IV secretion system protein VirD4
VILAAAWWFYENKKDAITGTGSGIFILAMTGLALLVWIFRDMETAPKPPEPPDEEPLSGNFGTASFMSPGGGPRGDPSTGVFFGKMASPDYEVDGGPIYSRPESHSIIFAKTRAGKGTRIIVPTLLKYGLGNKPMSVICLDPKGELSAITARTRAQHQHVHVINPWNELASTYAALGITSATFNPLDVLDRHDPNAVAVAQSLAAAICPQETGGKDGFWTENASSLLTAVLLWLADQPEETKTLARTREIVSLPRKELKEKFLIPMCASEAFGGAIRENAATFLDMAPETYSGVISNLGRFTKFLSDPQIKKSTATSSFSMADLTGAGRDRPTTLYIVIPTDLVGTQRTWLRLMITAGMRTFLRKPPGAKYRCLFLIDEFAALGKLDISIATMSGYGIDYALILQNLFQLKKVYQEEQNDIVSNCAYKWFCNINEPSTAEYLNKTLGKKTVRVKNKGENKGTSVGDKSHSRSEGESISYSETGRDLMTVDEILNMGNSNAILLSPAPHPYYVIPVDYWKLQYAFETIRKDYPRLYWPLYFDPNPYRAANDQAMPEDPLVPVSDAPARAPTTSNYNPGAYSPAESPAAPTAPKPAPAGRPINLSTYAPKRPEDAPDAPPKKSNYNPSTYSPKGPSSEE